MYPPIVSVIQRTEEQAKYERMWLHQPYRITSPGESGVMDFLEQARPRAGAKVLDLGCGTGRAGIAMNDAGLDVTLVDFARNCRDPEAMELPFVQHDLNKKLPMATEYAFCADVLEHIPPAELMNVIKNVLLSAQHIFLQIGTGEDRLGSLIGEPLHLSVHPFEWWHELFKSLDCKISHSADRGYRCQFYLSAWAVGEDFQGVLNVTEDKIAENIKTNIEAGWEQVSPHEENPYEVMILGGGPSLAQQLDRIKALRSIGVKLITLNGAYNWALANGLTPSAQVIVDGRKHNARFTKPVVADCKYMISSQCDPSVLEGLPRDRTYLWHTGSNHELLDAHYGEGKWLPIPGGATVLLRSIPLFRMLGFKSFHLFGCDSCLTERHHAYEQPENDQELVLDTIVGGRTFKCHAWMVQQGQGFLDLVKFIGDHIDIEIYGDGMLAHSLNAGAALEPTVTTE